MNNRSRIKSDEEYQYIIGSRVEDNDLKVIYDASHYFDGLRESKNETNVNPFEKKLSMDDLKTIIQTKTNTFDVDYVKEQIAKMQVDKSSDDINENAKAYEDNQSGRFSFEEKSLKENDVSIDEVDLSTDEVVSDYSKENDNLLSAIELELEDKDIDDSKNDIDNFEKELEKNREDFNLEDILKKELEDNLDTFYSNDDLLSLSNNQEENEENQENDINDIKEYLFTTMSNEKDLYKLAEFFKVFGDMSRIRILHLLTINEICVHEISNILDISQSATSHQLKILRDTKLVKPRKDGKHVYYSLSDNHVLEVFKNGLKHIKE